MIQNLLQIQRRLPKAVNVEAEIIDAEFTETECRESCKSDRDLTEEKLS